MSYLDLSIFEIHQALIEGKISPLDLVNESIKRAKEDSNNCFEYICEKEAILAAKNLDYSKKNNLLWGIPYCIKDNFASKNIPTCASSDALKGYIPSFDAEVINRLNEQGAILIGKNTMDELAMGGRGDTCHLGTVYNPLDPTHKRMVGGSSSGSVSCVSANIVPFAIGSDTGDSVRKPVAFAGVVGLKPTWGRVSRHGLFPFAPSLDHVGIVTRNIIDNSIVLNAIAGFDEKDSTCSKEHTEDYVPLATINKRYKIAVIKEIVESISDDDIKNLFMDKIALLKANNIDVELVSFDTKMLRMIYPTYMVISCAEAASNNTYLDGIKFGSKIDGESYEDIVINTRSALLSAPIKNRLIYGEFVLSKDNYQNLFVKAMKMRRLITETYKNLLSNYDAVFVPCSSSVAPLFTDCPDKFSDEYLISDNHLAIQNFGGFPSISFPIGEIYNLSFGGNLTSDLFKEKELLELANTIKNIIDQK